jgi:hypothetical protein
MVPSSSLEEVAVRTTSSPVSALTTAGPSMTATGGRFTWAAWTVTLTMSSMAQSPLSSWTVRVKM